MRKEDAIASGIIAAEAEWMLDHSLHGTWDGVVSLRRAVDTLAEEAEEAAKAGGYSTELNSARRESISTLNQLHSIA